MHINDVDLAVEASGDPADPTILLIGGAESTMDWWEDDFVARLAATGRHVIRYDTRDTGGSTTYPVGEPGYTHDDLVTDAIGVLDAYGVAAAHIVGISMGGGLAQHLGVRHPGRVLTLTLISTSPGGPGLPPMSAELKKRFSEPSPDPDWTDREAVIASFLDSERTFAGTIPVDEDRVRAIAGRVFDRSPALPSASNHWVIEGSDAIRPRLGEITAPTLVLHGTADALFPYGHAEALAREIPGATLISLPGVGHQMPPYPLWDTVIKAITEHTR